MEIDTARLRELLNKRDQIDKEIQEVATGKPKKPPVCKKCGEEGHTARWCTQKEEKKGLFQS